MASPNHFQFGKYYISIPRLKKNILSVRTENKSTILSSMITDEVKHLLLDFKDTGKFGIGKYSNFKNNNKEIMDRLLKSSGMDDRLSIRIENTDLNELLERYELLRGGVLQGNDSAEVRKELKHVVLKLVQLGKLPMKQSHQLLLELALIE